MHLYEGSCTASYVWYSLRLAARIVYLINYNLMCNVSALTRAMRQDK